MKTLILILTLIFGVGYYYFEAVYQHAVYTRSVQYAKRTKKKMIGCMLVVVCLGILVIVKVLLR